jgi:hypothetical protein
MAFNTDVFRSKLIGDGARQNLFEVRLTLPAIADASQNSIISFFMKTATLPPEEVGVIPVPYFGRQIKIPGNRTFPEWNTTVINDENFKIRQAFESWSNSINGHIGNLRDPAALIGPGGYATDITVVQYKKIGGSAVEYTLVNAWPSAVSPQDLDWSANDQIEEFQVTFQYDYWTNTGAKIK